MSPNPLSSGWTNVDDAAVPVRTLQNCKPVLQTVDTVHEQEELIGAQPSRTAMQLSAVSGIAVVLIGVTMVFGVDTLRGSLTETGSSVTTVTMTTENTFSPNTVTVAAGTTLTLENKNTNPQVIKAKTENELFPTQVIFDKPYTFTIPAGASGTFTYASETMPADQMLTIVVTPAIEATAVSSAVPEIPASAQASPEATAEDMSDFPLPFGEPMRPAAGSAPSVDISVAPTQPSGDTSATEVISVGAAAAENDTTSFAGGDIPTNPFTVANSKLNGNGTVSTGTLHSGAPLLEMQQYRPRTNTSTGPAEWGIFVATMMLMLMFYRMKVVL